MREDHAERLSKLTWRGYTVQADGIKPTQLVSVDGSADKTLPRYDGTSETDERLIAELRDAKHHARRFEAADLARPTQKLLSRIQRRGLDLRLEDTDGIRHVTLIQRSAPGRNAVFIPLFESQEEIRDPVMLSASMLDELEASIRKDDRQRFAPTSHMPGHDDGALPVPVLEAGIGAIRSPLLPPRQTGTGASL